MINQTNKPLTFCKTCGTNTEFYQCWCEKPSPVANASGCELGEGCRCKTFDVAYRQDCWNWIGEVKR